jgi:ferredoxin/flavodoxin---NADP+ reductase
VLRIAVIGSGPAGIYAAEALTRKGEASVDVFDALPCPYGLVRYGVAPDHPKIRSIIDTLRTVLEHPLVRFVGNVQVGKDITMDDLRQYYDATIVASGAAVDRRMGIPGEDLPGSVSATDFVAWYNGHPDAPMDRFTLQARTAIVVGMGNVAVDVARILAKSSADLRATDLPDHVLDVLDRSQVRDISMVGRRGPVQAKFTTKELRELGELPEADVIVEPADLELDEGSEQALATSPAARRNLDALRGWAQRPPAGKSRRLHLRFWLRPVEVLGDDRVTGLMVERTRPDEHGNAIGTGETLRLDADMVLRSIGYRGTPLPGLPFDEAAGVVPNVGGRVLLDGAPTPGWYVAGWIKRGPTGVIGTNRRDAYETVTALLEDAPLLTRAPHREPDAVTQMLASRGVLAVTWDGWNAIDVAEAERGRAQGRERSRIAQRESLLEAARAWSGHR